jgi:hypothetical protein
MGIWDEKMENNITLHDIGVMPRPQRMNQQPTATADGSATHQEWPKQFRKCSDVMPDEKGDAETSGTDTPFAAGWAFAMSKKGFRDTMMMLQAKTRKIKRCRIEP